MPARMVPERLARLHRAVAAARAAEEAGLSRLMSEIAACRARAEALRRSIAAPESGAGARSGPGGGFALLSAELAAATRWRDRLGGEARTELARAESLCREAQEARSRLAQAFGRERALANVLERAHREARRAAERRADEAQPAGRTASQSPLPDREPDEGTSAGSPGIA